MATVVIEMQNSAPYHIRTGWANVLRSIGYEVIEWWFEKESAFDLFNKHQDVQLFIGTTYNFNKSLDKIVRSRPYMKVALFGSAWGQLTDNLDPQKYPIVRVGQEEKQLLGKLYRDIRKPDCVFIHITKRHLEGSLGGWRSLGIPILDLLLGADLFTYYEAEPEEKYKCDIAFCGSRWPYKSLTLDKYIGKLCDERLFKTNIKIYGGGGWEVPQYLGSLNFGDDSKLFVSAKICPNISEIHSYVIDDLIERIWKVPCAGGFLISDKVDLSETGLQNIVPQFDTYEKFVEIIDFYLNPTNESQRLDLLSKQKLVILSKHTYHDRMAKLLKFLGLSRESDTVVQKKSEMFGLSSAFPQ